MSRAAAAAPCRRRPRESQRAPARARLRSAVCRRPRRPCRRPRPGTRGIRARRHFATATGRHARSTVAPLRIDRRPRAGNPSLRARRHCSRRASSARSNCSRAAVQSPLSQVDQPQRRVCLGDFIVRRQRALGTALRQLRERRLILSAETQVSDRQRCTSTRETRLHGARAFPIARRSARSALRLAA